MTNISQSILNNELLDAITNGKLEDVKICLAANANIHCNNHLPLILAAEYGHLDVVQYLVEKGADIHGQDNWAFVLSCSNGHLPVAKFLFELLKDTFEFDYSITNSLDLAINQGHEEIVDYLFEKSPHLEKNKNVFIAQAAYYNSIEVVHLLASKYNADIRLALQEARKNKYETEEGNKFIDWCQNYISKINMHDNLMHELNKSDVAIKQKKKI